MAVMRSRLIGTFALHNLLLAFVDHVLAGQAARALLDLEPDVSRRQVVMVFPSGSLYQFRPHLVNTRTSSPTGYGASAWGPPPQHGRRPQPCRPSGRRPPHRYQERCAARAGAGTCAGLRPSTSTLAPYAGPPEAVGIGPDDWKEQPSNCPASIRSAAANRTFSRRAASPRSARHDRGSP